MLGSLAVAWASRRLRLPAPVRASASVLALLWFLALVFFRETLWGPFPTLDSLRAIGSAADAGMRLAREEVAPVPTREALLVLLAVGVWATTWLVDAALAARRPLLAVVAALPIFSVPGAVVLGEARWLDAGLFLAAAAWLLFAEERRHAQRWALAQAGRRPGWRAGPAVRLGAAAVALAVVASPLLPGFAGPPGLRGRGGFGSAVAFNPIVAIKPTLDNERELVLFRVRMPHASYLRLTALDTFDGTEWRQGDLDGTLPAADPPSRTFLQDVQIVALAGVWLPAAFEPTSVDVDVRRDPRNAALLQPTGVVGGLRYQVVSDVPDVDARDLDSPLPARGEALGRYLALPSGVARDLAPLASEITGDSSTPYERAVAIQEHLRRFRYDEKVAARHDFDTIRQFLTETKRGYCEQFATTMAALARVEGIPSRVVIGFGIGEQVEPDLWEVTTRHAHAWVELFFPDAGWVAFEPTPRGGVAVPAPYTFPARDPASAGGPGASPGPDETGGAPGRDRDPRDAETPAGGRAVRPVVVRGLATAGLVVAAAFFFAAAALGALAIARRRRIAHAPDARAAVRMRYLDFLAWCDAAGVGRGTGETPREHARRLGARASAAAGPLDRLALAVEVALWAPPNGYDPAATGLVSREARRALAGTLPRTRRALAWAGWGRWRSR